MLPRRDLSGGPGSVLGATGFSPRTDGSPCPDLFVPRCLPVRVAGHWHPEMSSCVRAPRHSRLFLLTDHEDDVVHRYIPWIEERNHGCRVHVLAEGLSSPTAFGEIYAAAVRGCGTALSEGAKDASLTFHLSPGTPAMAAVWIIRRMHGGSSPNRLKVGCATCRRRGTGSWSCAPVIRS